MSVSILDMECSNCASVPSEEVILCIEDNESENRRQLTVQLCGECIRSFEETAGVSVSRPEWPPRLRESDGAIPTFLCVTHILMSGLTQRAPGFHYQSGASHPR
jgi:hypothetical protein